MKNALVLCLLSTTLLWAQGERGALNGTVLDASGSAVPNASVVALETTTGVETKTATTESGVYRIPYLPPGNYRVTVTKPGFRSTVTDNVTLRVAQTLTVDFQLQLGQVTEAVNVTSEAPAIETGTAEIGRYVSEKEFDSWPIVVGDGRRQIQSFIFRSLPGTVGNEFQGSINGGQFYSHEILIEGIPLGRFDLQGGSNNELSPSAESVSEFKLQTGTIGAQYGGGQTAVANFAIKSGTNQLHGSAYTYIQNDVLRANTFINNSLNRPRAPFKSINYGGSLGGPVLVPKVYDGRNKTFFFGSYEATRQRNFLSTAFGTLPTLDFRRGDFSRLFNAAYTGTMGSGTSLGTDALGRTVTFGQIYDPATTRTVNGQVVRDPFPGNVIPTSRWDPVARAILEQAPITDPINGNLYNNIAVLASGQPVFDEKMLTLKGDHVFNGYHRLAGYFSLNDRNRNNSPGGRWGAPPGTPTSVWQYQRTPGKLVRLSYDWTLTPSILNHFAVGYNRFGNFNESVFVDQDWPQKIGIQNVPGTHFPTLTFQGPAVLGGNVGSAGRLGSANAGGTFNGSTIFMDDLTFVRGKHNFRTGFELRMYYYNSRGKSGSGAYNFNPIQTELPGFSGQTGHAFASFLLGAVSTASRGIVLTNPGHRVRVPSLFFADDWKVNQKLTLNLGLRWESIGGTYEVAGRMSNLDPALPNPNAGGRPGAIVFAEDQDVKSFQQRNWAQFSPRLGFAYAFTPKFVLRGGYGVGNMPPVTGFGLPELLGYNGSVSVNLQTRPQQFSQDPVMYLREPFPNPTVQLPNRNPGLQNGQSVVHMSSDSTRLGYVQNYSLGVQVELPARVVLETSFIGNVGNRLLSRGLDLLNQNPVDILRFGDALLQPLANNPGLAPLPYEGFTGTLAQALRRFPQYQGVSQYLPNFGHSSYNSLQLMGRKYFSSGLSVLTAYTFSRTIADAESALDNIGAQDVYNRRLERSVTSFHTPHNFKLSWLYELPIGQGKALDAGRFLNAIIGGWVAGGIHNYRTGDTLQVTTSGPRSGDTLFNGVLRPDLVAGVPISLDGGSKVDTVGGTPYLNPAAFAQVPTTANGVPLRLGTAPRYLPNVLGPSVYTEDFTLKKQFGFGEQRYFRISADLFNAFNRAGLGNPTLDITNRFFGRITSARQGPRNIQLEARVEF